FRPVGRITEHLARPVADELDRARSGRAHCGMTRLGDFKDGPVTAGPQVDRLSNDLIPIGVKQTVERVAVVVDKHEVAGSRTVTMHGQGLTEDAAGDESWNDLLEMLSRTIVVEGPDDHR